MMYVDQAFPISDEDVMMETSYAITNRPPVKEIALAVSLFIFGIIGILLGVFMTYNRISSDRNHGLRESSDNDLQKELSGNLPFIQCIKVQ
ncbi:hypothetical protein K2173_008151 [Erythroxylum novogranatense]|uniref:Uncharacterized protein n=1 Tax=Erythroxylum novogranatense TaxID=1862640 RepID=A0AAV8UC09_9ROSI|nr:hypothetical protein K2173_008151 [Erythroxylum novogranatense]